MSRIDRINSLLREVISDIIRLEVRNPHVSQLVAITAVECTKDLGHAKVFVSIIGDDKVKEETLKALNQSAGFIAQASSKQVSLRYFPNLHFFLDDTVEKQMRIDSLLKEIQKDES